jgi:hypothetical protein
MRAGVSQGREAKFANEARPVLAVSGQHPGLASIASRSFFLSGQLLLGNLNKTVVVVGNAPHDRPSFLVCHLIGNPCELPLHETPMLRAKRTFWMAWAVDYQEFIGAKKQLGRVDSFDPDEAGRNT